MAPHDYSEIQQFDQRDEATAFHEPRKHAWIEGSFLSKTYFLLLIFTAGIIIGAILPMYQQRGDDKSSVTALLPLSSSHSALTTDPEEYSSASCGSTPDEAISRGCVFDLMNYAWTPPECYSSQLLNESLALYFEPWKWYSSRSRTPDTEVLQDSEVLSRMETVYGDHAYHVAHCLYMWRTLQWALFGNLTKLQHHYATFEHQGHCIELLSREQRNDAKHATIHLEYVKCVNPERTMVASQQN